ncbi:type II toxin-antitoxin system Phd/YefM family antitoxin [uncultured Sphingomonas sp.]|uniref:type II toxin-antitoxin system Phd/YefM family antitoxin n=1 Tax=uncultured Sphingomonas sp. TaxID=158754 RepID=UPI0035CB616C
MSSYSVAEAKNGLPGLIDRALDGEEVLITRHGRVVVEIRPAFPKEGAPADRRAGLDWLRARREARPSIDVDSNEMLRALADERRW